MTLARHKPRSVLPWWTHHFFFQENAVSQGLPGLESQIQGVSLA
jgi:hypothetical protein